MQVIDSSNRVRSHLQAIHGLEIAASAQYARHAALFKAAGYAKLAGKYAEEAAEELGHAQRVLYRMHQIGADVAETEVALDASADSVPKAFRADIRVEEKAINAYRNAIEAADDASDYGTFALLQQLLTETEEHYWWLSQQLRLIENIGLPDYLSSQI